MKYLLTALFTIATVAPIESHGSPGYYICQVSSDAHIKNSGALDLLRNSPRIGEKFSVNKKTGAVAGDIFDALNTPQLIARGSDQNSFKVLWIQKSAGKNGAFVDYLSIEEFVKGKKKPFGFFSGGLLMTGSCE